MQENNRGVWIGVIIAILIIAGVGWYYLIYTAPEAAETVIPADEAQVRGIVTEFGTKFQNVSLEGPDEQVRAEIRTNYAPYVSDDLLQRWLDDPSIAPGRLTSSPWPDHIEITDVEKGVDGSYVVEGSVIEKSNGTDGTTSYSITLTLRLLGGAWKVTDVRTGLIQVDENGDPIIEIYKG